MNASEAAHVFVHEWQLGDRDPEDIEGAPEAFDAWCDGEGIATEFRHEIWEYVAASLGFGPR